MKWMLIFYLVVHQGPNAGPVTFRSDVEFDTKELCEEVASMTVTMAVTRAEIFTILDHDCKQEIFQ